MIQYKIRPYKDETDRNFVVGMWMNTFLRSNTARRAKNRNHLYPDIEPWIARLIPISEIYIACKHRDHDTMYGMIVGETKHCGMVHSHVVKLAYRGYGIGKALIKRLFGEIPDETFYTFDGVKLPKQGIYCPHMLMEIFNGTVRID